MEKRNNVSVLVNLFVTLVIVYLIYLIFLFFIQRTLIFPGRSIGKRDYQEDWVREEQKTWINTPAGKIETWYIPSEKKMADKQNPVIILAHGNYELIDFCEVETRGLNTLGYDVFLIEYPGFGRSQGKTSRENINLVYIHAYDWLLETKKTDPDLIIGFGRSLGGGVICDLAEKRSLEGIILQSTFTSVESFARRYGAPSFLTRDRFNNLESLRNFTKPILIIHGKHDTLIPYRHGKTLAEKISQAQLITYDCGHNDCPPDWEAYWETIDKFIRTTLRR